MVETGIDLTNYGPASREDLVVDQDDGEDCEDDFGVEETGEEEEREVDEGFFPMPCRFLFWICRFVCVLPLLNTVLQASTAF